jgi:von Hippel-Lindau disease tumor supressor
MVLRRVMTCSLGLLMVMVMGVSGRASAATAEDCLHQTELKSPPGKVATEISFHNKSAEPRRLYWIDGNGKRKFFGAVAPGQTSQMSTFAGHVWVVTNTAEQCLSVVVASSARIVVDISRGDPAATPKTQPQSQTGGTKKPKHNPADDCTRHQVYSSKLGRCVSKASTCSRNQVYSSSMGQCVSKAVTCSANQVYSSSVHACIPKG